MSSSGEVVRARQLLRAFPRLRVGVAAVQALLGIGLAFVADNRVGMWLGVAMVILALIQIGAMFVTWRQANATHLQDQ